MQHLIAQWKQEAQERYDQTLSFLTSLRGQATVDRIAADIDHQVFAEEVDCLACANCCKTTPAIVTRPDAKRIAKHLHISPKAFIKKYLIEDIDGELMINGVPCTFLNDDHTCAIYEVRPQACREYPHMGQRGFHRRAKLNAKNTIVCPAAYEIVKRLEDRI